MQPLVSPPWRRDSNETASDKVGAVHIVSRGELIEHLYAQDHERDSNTVEVFIARLRKKLPPGLIETVRGLGYRLADAA